MIRHLIGIPFAWGGRTLEGADCLGLLHLALEAKGITFQDPWETYSEAIEVVEVLQAVPPTWQKLEPLAPLQECDVVLVDNARGGHVFVADGRGYLLTTNEQSTSYLVQERRVASLAKVLGYWRPS